MRISLLLQREPFGAILENTLAGFLRARTGDEHKIKWYPQRQAIADARQQGQQLWLCNIFLNAIFVQEARPQIFLPIQQEFGHSRRWWLRPAQATYVALATRQPMARWLAQAVVAVSPALAEAENVLIVAGNHKLRLLNGADQRAFGILKHGFKPDFMQREIEARRIAQALELPVPPLCEIAEDKTWFSEQYVSGRPINRLADGAASQQAALRAAHDLRRFLEHSAVDSVAEEYAAALVERLKHLIQTQHLLTTTTKRKLSDSIDEILAEINRRSATVSRRFVLALTHGDFQPANILVNEAGHWLIDWEYSQQRQVLYDALVFGLAARSPRGLAGRVQQYLHRAPDALESALWPGAAQDADTRRLRVLVFLLEELDLHLTENANTCFTQIGGGLAMLMAELQELVNGTGFRE